MTDETRQTQADNTAAWEEHEMSQLRYFRSLSLRKKMEAVQGMADVYRHFQQMWREGRFTSRSIADAEK